MKNIVTKYLKKNYQFNLYTYDTYLVKEIYSDVDVKISDVIYLISKLFGLSSTETFEVFDFWADQELIIINNKIVELRERLYNSGISTPELNEHDTDNLESINY